MFFDFFVFWGGKHCFLFSKRGKKALFSIFQRWWFCLCVFSEQGIPPCVQRNEQIYCILFKEICIKACCTVLKEYHGVSKCNCLLKNTRSIPFKIMSYIPSARNTIFFQRTIPCIAFSYRNMPLFQRDCCIYERVTFCTRA